MDTTLLQDLQNTTDPAEKAALIAEVTLSNLPPAVALAARRGLVLHWFNQDIVSALLPGSSREHEPAAVYQRLAGLSFMEATPYGLAYHDLTRAGLLKRLSRTHPDLLKEAAALAAPVYAGYEDKTAALEGLYCYTLAGATAEALELLETLLFWAGARADWPALLKIFEIRDEAERYEFATPLPRAALHYFAAGLARQSLQQYQAALADYGRAVELNPDYAAAYYNTACAYALQSRVEAALPPLR
ncbi:MAG: tetratricopeptide repeat protein, partial [Chloroflexota bacterium]